jgi:hypothetical protein
LATPPTHLVTVGSSAESLTLLRRVRSSSGRWQKTVRNVFADRIDVLVPSKCEQLFVSACNVPIVNAAGAPVACSGPVRKSGKVRHGRFEFPIETSARRQVELQLRFAISARANVAISIAGDVVHTMSADAAGAVTLHSATLDLTRWTEAAQQSTIDVDFDFGDAKGELYVFATGHCAPQLRRSFATGYTLRSLAFFTLCGVLMVAAALVLAGVTSTIKTSYRAVGVGLIAAVAVYHLFGGPDLPAITPRKHMRALFGRTRAHPRLVMTALLLLTAVLVVAAFPIVGALYRRQRYESAIEDAMDGGDAKKAFLLSPWRREGQILIERTAFGYRSRTNNRLREYLQSLVNDREFEAAALSSPTLAFRDIRPFSGVTNDPATWYVNLLLESNTENARDRASQILKGRSTEQALVLSAFLDLNRTKGTLAQEGVVIRIEKLLDDPQTPEFKNSFLYQNACDGLAATYITAANTLRKKCGSKCTAAERAEIRKRLDAALERYQMLLDTRSDALKDETHWLRPPHKLYLYHMLHPSPADSPAAVQNARILQRNYALSACVAVEVAEKDCDSGQLPKLLRVHDLDSRPKWLEGTVRDAKLRTEITQKLATGWRF